MPKAGTRHVTESAGDAGIRLDSVSGLLGYNLRRAQVATYQAFSRAFDEIDVRPVQVTLLLLLQDNPGAKHVQLASVLGIRRANMVALINELEKRGFVRREANPQDRRAHALFLTDDGEAFSDRLREMHLRFEGAIAERLGHRDFATLVRLLDALCRTLPDDEASS